jgi:predicted glutamine amidotransferase
MCELLGMSANVPTDICFSFTGLMHRGGRTGPHRDGWGITFYEDRGFRTFTREQWGSFWTFAHNGQLSGYEERLMPGKHRPVGDTDSEAAFCWLLNELHQKYPRKPANMKAMFQYAGELCSRLNDFGICNMLLSDGRYLLAYCSTSLHWITRRAPFGKARLIDEDVVIDFHQETTPHDIVTVIATLPLTRDEQWRAISPRHYRLFHYGECIAEQDI